jgi:hypothetical protein
MKMRALVVTLLAALCMPAFGAAQVTAPTPTPDPLVYDDPGMHYVAPAGARLMGQMEEGTPDKLSQDPTTVATWLVGTGRNTNIISISMELYSGDLDGFDSTFENTLRGEDSATLVKSKEHVFLSNPMPALFVDVTQGAGFSTHKIFAYIWIDRQRAVVLSDSCLLGGCDEDSAKRLLAGATAVAYPTQPQY